MDSTRPIWLVANSKSGSNDEDALAAFRQECDRNGLRVAHFTDFPEFELPTPAMLDAANIELLAIFAGDGTLNSAIERLSGWGGKILVLPGGTMNLLYHRLFGEQDMNETLCAVARGDAFVRRPAIIRSEAGVGLAGMLIGPGTSWNRVREAMREYDIVEMAGGTVSAIEETLGGDYVACTQPPMGRPEGYPLLLLDPSEKGIRTIAFHAENAAEYLDQAWALLRRDFRQGPHEQLGITEKLVIGSTRGEPIGLLVDGEPAEASPQIEFTLARCEVDLLATRRDA